MEYIKMTKKDKRKKEKRKKKKEKKLISCFYSSFIFIMNILISYCYDNYLYSILFLGLLVSSLCYHSKPTIYTYLIDKVNISLITFYGGWLLLKKYSQINNKKRLLLLLAIVSTFIVTNYFYFYGYFTKTFCFYKNKEIANLYHSIMHIVASMGHILIVVT